MKPAKQINYYEALGLDDNASSIDIEIAYENIKGKYNVFGTYDPININLGVKRRILTIATEAYKTLSNPAKRKVYNDTWNEDTKTTRDVRVRDLSLLAALQDKKTKNELIDYYDLLGIPQTASWENINQAYIRMASLYYPSMNKSDSNRLVNDSIYRFLTEAHTVLSSKESRKAYDEKLNRQRWEKERKTEKSPIKVDPKRVNENYKKENNKNKKRKKPEKNAKQHLDSKDDSDLFEDIVFKVTSGVIRMPQKIWRRISKDPNKATLILAGAITLGTIIGGTLASNNEKEAEPQPTRPPITMPVEEEEPDEIVLNRIHVVEEGEVLQKFSKDSNTLVSYIKEINHIENSDLIHPGETIVIPYIIDKEDLDYYTQKVERKDGMSVQQLAKEYGTDVETLVAINKKDILVMPQETGPEKNSYIPLSDTLLVPNFISKQTYNSLKSSGQTNIQTPTTGQQK